MNTRTPLTAPRSDLERLHAALVAAILKRMSKADKEPLAAAEITAIAKFLADNDIKASEDERDVLASVFGDDVAPFPTRKN